MEVHLPAFKEKNPQLEVVTELIRGQHPHLKGFYSETFFRFLPLSFSLFYTDICTVWLHCKRFNSNFLVNFSFCQMHREQKPKGDMCEKYGSRWGSSICNNTKKCVGKKGGETEDQACDQTP